MRVLLAEDDPHMREFVKDSLSLLPDAVVVFESASHLQTRQWLAENPDAWDLALVDVFLTEGNGFRILKDCAVRKPHQRVIIMSNYVNDLVRTRVLAEGADAFLSKSDNPRDLIDCLSNTGLCS